MRWQRAPRPKFTEWHRWFAWHPVTTISGIRVWLEVVERKGNFLCYNNDEPVFEMEYTIL